jgi:hypothetical protein
MFQGVAGLCAVFSPLGDVLLHVALFPASLLFLSAAFIFLPALFPAFFPASFLFLTSFFPASLLLFPPTCFYLLSLYLQLLLLDKEL